MLSLPPLTETVLLEASAWTPMDIASTRLLLVLAMFRAAPLEVLPTTMRLP